MASPPVSSCMRPPPPPTLEYQAGAYSAQQFRWEKFIILQTISCNT